MTKFYATFLFLLLFTPVFGQWTGQWTQVPNMSEVRSEHQLLPFSNGKVLAIGGWNGTANSKTSEHHNLTNSAWVPSTNEMNVAHTTGAAVVLGNGKGLITGGYTGSVQTAECELYDTSTNTWSAAGALNAARSYHTATVLQSGKVLVTGGYNGSINLTSCELYDPTTNMWTAVPTGLTTGRSYHTATLMADGRVLIAGGYNPNAGYQLNSVEIYDPIANSVAATSAMSNSRAWHAASLLDDGKVLVSGGEFFNGGTPFAYNGMTSCELYNPTTNLWESAASLPTGICCHQQFSVEGNRVVAVAGASNTNYSGSFTFSPGVSYVYNVQLNTWDGYPMTFDGRVSFAAAKVGTNRIMVCGGIGQNEAEYFTAFNGVSNQSISKSGSVVVFPNPSQGEVYLQTQSQTNVSILEVSDMMGKLHSVKTDKIGASQIRLDFSELPAGIYWVGMDVNGKSELVKIAVSGK